MEELSPDFDFDPVFGLLCTRPLSLCSLGNSVNVFIKLEKSEFMREEMEYLGFDAGYGWWKPGAAKMQPLLDMQIRDVPKKGLHDVRSFIGACNFYWRHIQNFTYSSAP